MSDSTSTPPATPTLQHYYEGRMGAAQEMSDLRVQVAKLEERVTSLFVIFDEREKQVRLAFASAEKASTKAEDAQAKVNASQNEFRGALKDQAQALATKEDVSRVVDRVTNLEKGDAEIAGLKTRSAASQTLTFAIIGVVLTLVGFGIAYFTMKPGP